MSFVICRRLQCRRLFKSRLEMSLVVDEVEDEDEIDDVEEEDDEEEDNPDLDLT